MGIFNRKEKREKEKETLSFARAMTHGEGTKVVETYVDEFGRFQAMLQDEQLKQILSQDALLSRTIPARSPLNRTGNYGERDKRIQLLQFQGLNLLTMMQMDEEDFEAGGALLVEAFDIYDYNLVCDNVEGWKARVSTEIVKRIETKVEQGKKKGRIFS